MNQTPGVGTAPNRREQIEQNPSPTLIAGIAALSLGLAGAGVGPGTVVLAESAIIDQSQVIESSANVTAPYAMTASGAPSMADGYLMLVQKGSIETDRAGSLSDESRELREQYRAKRKELRFSAVLFSGICLGSVMAILFGANPLFWTPIALGSLGVGGSSAIYLRRLGTLGC